MALPPYRPQLARLVKQPPDGGRLASRDEDLDEASRRHGNRRWHRDQQPGSAHLPGTNITKLALAQFYERIADWILPHMIGRPLTLVRCPEGLPKPCFYMKHSKSII